VGEEEDGELRARHQHPGLQAARPARSNGAGDAADPRDRHVLRELVPFGEAYDEGGGGVADGSQEPAGGVGEDITTAPHQAWKP